MPDVSRSDSLRSDTSTSLRPRVSFNRDVHVKRIVSRESPQVVGALSGDGAGHLVTLPVRKERLAGRSKKQLAQEAAKVLHQVDKVDCTANNTGVLPEKFYTLPVRRKQRRNNSESPHSSQEGINPVRRRSEELGVTSTSVPPPKKPPRTFETNNKPQKQKNTILKLFSKSEKETEPKKSNLRRSVSDASNLKSNAFEKSNRKRPGNESEENHNNSTTKKLQLSPIIEVSTPREDYFTPKKGYFSDKENDNVPNKDKNVESNLKTPRKKWDKFRSPDSRKELKEKNELGTPEVVIIDVDKAESITQNKRNKKLSSNSFKDKFKFLSLNKDNKKSKAPTPVKNAKKLNEIETNGIDEVDNINLSLKDLPDIPEGKTSPWIQDTIKTLEESVDKHSEMIHSSQKPAEKIPLTRGHTVDTMIRRLNRDKFSPPPKTNTILVTPTVTVAHNNNQPFSYIQPREMSPERPYSRSKSPPFDKPSSPIIYAQVVVGNGDADTPGIKQTIHTAYKKQFQHSDSDEGLGYEENSGFSRKYTQFGDEKKISDKFDDEYPITPKFKSNGFSNGYDYNEYSKSERTAFVDSSARGRGDGMDSRRRESLTEPHLIDNGINTSNGKSDLSYRRDLLESRIKSRRLGEKHIITNDSPEFPSKSYKSNPRVNKYVTETTSRYYRHGSTSPVGFTENYSAETKIDRNGEKQFTENRSRTHLSDRNTKYPEIQDDYDYRNNNKYDRYEGEPKSLDSQVSSSPESGVNRKTNYTSHEKDYRSLHYNRYKTKGEKTLQQDRDHHKSNPEITRKTYEPSYKYDDHNRLTSETYHDSLRRQKHDVNRENSGKSEKYFDERERKDKFGDSGIENDFRRDSGENVRVNRSYNQNYRSNNESEDEGFASSLLIASERQHTEDNFGKERYRKEEIHRNGVKKHEYIHRERSIDDGSHYDPRIDKDLNERNGTLKVEKKPPKPAKISSLKKVKQLFTRDTSKKVKKDKADPPRLVREESLRARYKEYRGSSETLNKNTLRREVHSDRERSDRERSDRERREQSQDSSKHDSSFDSRREYSDSRADNSDNSQIYDYSNRRRMSTPSPSPTREIKDTRDRDLRDSPPNNTQSTKHDSWFKSLDRFSLKKKQSEKIANKENIKVVESPKPPVPQTKNLRFFGDTDLESDTSVRRKSSLKSRPNLPSYKSATSTKTRSQSSRNLHNISEEHNNSDADTLRKYKSYKSMQNITDSNGDVKGSKSNLKPPISPNRRMDTLKSESRKTDSRNRKRRGEINSVESSTEGDSSQQSQRSVVYLHAATVGDIPGPGYLARNGRRAASKEDLISNGSSRMHTQSKTLSRSFSVLAPWKPKHASEGYDIDYSQQKPVKPMRNGSSKSGGKTAKEISNQKKMSSQNVTTLNRKTKSKENISSQTLNRRPKEEMTKSSTTTLYKKKDRNAKDNMRYSRDDKKIASKSMSVESLGDRSSMRSKDERIISRSVSMPRDPDKSAGWFKMNKKNSKRTVSTQRL